MPETGQPAEGTFPALPSITPYGKKAPPPAAQIGGGAAHYLVKRGYIEVMVDVRGTGFQTLPIFVRNSTHFNAWRPMIRPISV